MSSSIDVATSGDIAGASDVRFRAGEQILTVLATPLNVMVLRALAQRPMRLAELRQATGLPAQTTLRGHLTSLAEIGAVSKRPTTQMPYAVENELTPMGECVIEVADQLEAWLSLAPAGPISLEAGGARGVVKAFVDGWGSTMLRGLAARPMSLHRARPPHPRAQLPRARAPPLEHADGRPDRGPPGSRRRHALRGHRVGASRGPAARHGRRLRRPAPG